MSTQVQDGAGSQLRPGGRGFQAPLASYDLFPSGAGVVGLGQVWGAVASSSIL